MNAVVELSGSHIHLKGGHPGGRDDLHKVVATWAGWRRHPVGASLPGGERCSLYLARCWESTIAPLIDQKSIELEWLGGCNVALADMLGGLNDRRLALEATPTQLVQLKWQDEWKRQPMHHQAQAVAAIKAMGYRALLTDDMGLGKTSTSIWAWQQTGAPRVLVVCPASVKFNWRKELWATLNEVDVYLIDGLPKQRATVFSEAAHVGKSNRSALIINYDLLYRLGKRERTILTDWCCGHFLILDESHYVKGKSAERTKFVFNNLAPADGGAMGRLCLTGTPIRNTSEDIWAQIQIVRPGIWSSYHQFERFHLERSKHTVEIKSKKGRVMDKTLTPVRRIKHREQLNAIVNTLQVRRKKEDVLNLPEKIHTYPQFHLDEPTWRIYSTMRDLTLIDLADLGDDMPIFHPQAKSALEATLRLEQIAQGFLGGIPDRYMDQVFPLIHKRAEKIEGRPGEVIFPQSAKIEWLCETIDSVLLQGGQPVIFSRFNAPLFWLQHQWTDCGVLHGGLTATQRAVLIDSFQDHATKVLLCQVKIAEGFNLTSSQDCLFLGRDWAPAANDQAEDRLHRIGQTGTVNVQIPLVLKTFEIYLHRKLEAKSQDAELSLQDMTIGELRKAL